MKPTKKETAWYNTRSKALNGIFPESRRTIARCAGPHPDPRAGLRLPELYPGFRADIL